MDGRDAEDQAATHGDRLRILSEVSRTFAEARLNHKMILDIAAARISKVLGDGCIIRLFSKAGSRLEPVSFHHPDPDALALIRQLLRNTYTAPGEGLTGQVVQTGTPMLIPVATREQSRAMLKTIYWPYLDRFPVHSWMFMPLVVAGQPLGSVTVFRDQSTAPYNAEDLAFLQDLAYRAALAIDNAALYAEAQRAIQLREEFMAIASHELKTPLTPLKLQLQLLSKALQSGALNLGPRERDLVQLISRSEEHVTRLVRLVDALLEESRISAGRLSLMLETVDLGTLTREVFERLRSEVTATGCAVELKLDPGVTGLWDRLRLEQVVTNLLTNALKYGGGKPIRIGVFVRAEHAVIEIQDHGIGISREDQDRIFERFERAVSLQRFTGLGMGLFIARQLVEAHHGRISLISEPGHGATFTVELPRSPQAKRGDAAGP